MPTLILTLLGNRFAKLGRVVLVGFEWGGRRTHTSWGVYIARERAAAEAALKIERSDPGSQFNAD